MDNDPKDIPPTDDYDDGLVDNETAAIDIYDPNFFLTFFFFWQFSLSGLLICWQIFCSTIFLLIKHPEANCKNPQEKKKSIFEISTINIKIRVVGGNGKSKQAVNTKQVKIILTWDT